MSTTNVDVEGISAELVSIVETADLIANQGLQPGSDGPRVLAALIGQLGTQMLRMIQPGASDPRSSAGDSSPNETDTPTEEDRSPEDAPAEPRRAV